MDLDPSPIFLPGIKILKDLFPVGKVMGQHAPGSAGSDLVEAGINDLSRVSGAGTTANLFIAFSRW